MGRDRISRRGFLKTGAVAVGGGAALTATAAGAQAPEVVKRNEQEGMRYRLMGRTGWRVSELSFGGLGATAPVMTSAFEKGVNFLHTSHAYGDGASFVECAKVLPDHRDSLFLAVKAFGADVDEFAGWLNALKVEKADVIFHPTTNPADGSDASGALREKFQALKDRGLVDYLGLTVHSEVVPTMNAAVQVDFWDCLMPVYALAVRPDHAGAMQTAGEKNIGVLSMKTLQGAGGEGAVAAFKTALDSPALTSVLKGMTSFHLLDSLSSAVGERPTADEQASLYQNYVAQRSSSCAMCSACSGCPQGLAVEEIVRCSLYYEGELGDHGHARQVYRELPAERTAAACADCGTCEQACPNGLPIREIMRATHDRLA